MIKHSRVIRQTIFNSHHKKIVNFKTLSLNSKNKYSTTEPDSRRCDDILAAEVRGNTWRANFKQEDLVEEAVKRNGGGGGESGRWRSWVRVRVRNFRVPGIPGKRVFGKHHLRRMWWVDFFLHIELKKF